VRTAASSLAVKQDGPALPGHHTGELKVDAALGAHIAKMGELAWLVLQLDTKEVHQDSPSAWKSNTSESMPMRVCDDLKQARARRTCGPC
jgi:hypothetical protein